MSPVEVSRGDGPIVLGMPHTGTELPAEIAARLNDAGLALTDTDWHVNRLYDGLRDDATTVRATFHRVVIDANREPSGESLYPGQNTTGLCPMTDFDGKPIYRAGLEPDDDEIERRRVDYHAPYHAALAGELARLRDLHGIAVLFDCHSIRSQVPYLFEGTLPDLNIGTFAGRSCAGVFETAVAVVAGKSPYSSVVNGRFKGGWTTRHYGRPDEGIHAVQLELAQSTYLQDEAPPWIYDEMKANALRHELRAMLNAIADIAADLSQEKRP